MTDALINDAREALQQSYDYDRDNRREAMEDLRFIAGFQWSDAARAERRGRPMITINRSQQFLRQVSNPIRKNMPVIKVEPDGDDQSNMAEIANGMLRRIQYNSSASHVYSQAVEHAVGCGIGWFRIVSKYIDDESFNQEILIKRVFNPLTVYPDPAALEPDRSDMNWCIVSEPMPLKAFKAKYPGKATDGMETPGNAGGATEIIWGTGEWVRVAEYWRRKETTKTLALLKDGQLVELTAMGKKQLAGLKESGAIVTTREAKDYTVEMTLVSGQDQLEETYEFPCQYIPLIPVIGAEVPMDKGVYRHGLIRFQREPQQLHNYFLSVAAESLGQQPKSPYLVTQDMIAKYKNLWDNANRDATPYLPYTPDPKAPTAKPERIDPPPMPAALVQMAQMMAEDMKSATGIYDAALGNRSNETSGVAIAAREEQGNQATFHYVDNLEHSLEHLGRCLVEMIPKVYDTERTLKIMGEDDTEKEITVNKTVMEFAGQPIKVNDLAGMKFNSVRVVLGPSYASRRMEAVNQLMQLVQAFPQVGMVAGDIIAKNLDFDGADQLAERLKALLPPQVLQLENPEGAQAQAPPPDPMAEMQMQGAAQMMEHELTGAEAKAHQEQAKAAQEAAKVKGAQLDNALKVKKLVEPPPQRHLPGRMSGNQARP
jgi:hypothetical protein